MSKKNRSGDPRKRTTKNNIENQLFFNEINHKKIGWKELSNIWNSGSFSTILTPVSFLKDDVLDVVCKTDKIIEYCRTESTLLDKFCFELTQKKGKMVYRIKSI